MEWSALATQFCLEISFGVLLALAFVPRAPVGVLFYRIMGTAALLPILVSVLVPIATGSTRFGAPVVLFSGLAVLAYPVYSGPVRGRRWALGLALGLVGCAGALVLSLRDAMGAGDPAALLLTSLTALSTGAVTGSVGLAMVLGHWYLTVPNLDVRFLRRLNRVTVISMLACLALLGISCLVFAEELGRGEQPLLGPTGLFYFGTRVAVGLLFPLLFAWMAAESLKFKNTRSATGILYASTVLVMIGTAVSVSLQDSYGIPL